MPNSAFLKNISSQNTQAILNLLMLERQAGAAILSPTWALKTYNQKWLEIITRYRGVEEQLVLEDSLAAHILDAELLFSSYIEQVYKKIEVISISELKVTCNNNVFYWKITLFPLAGAKNQIDILIIIEDKTDTVIKERQIAKNLNDQEEKLSALYDVMSATAEAPDLKTTLSWSLERIMDAVKCSEGTIHLIDNFDPDEPVDNFELIAFQGMLDNDFMALKTIPATDKLIKLVANKANPVTISNLLDYKNSAFYLLPLAKNQTFIGVPMRVRDKMVGILSVFSPNDRLFGDVELALLDSVGDQIAIVVENAYLYKQAEELAVIEERNRLARELHDSVTQAIYSLTLFAEAGLRLIKSGNRELVEDCLNRLNDASQQALREMRLLLHKLRPPDLEEEGLIGALQQRLDEVEARANIEAQLLIEGDVEDLPDAVEMQLYRIAQEALNNALKHSSASLLQVKIEIDDDSIKLEVIDDGNGFALANAEKGGGMGLRNMEERTETLDGELIIKSVVGEGTSVVVNVNLDDLENLEESDELF